MPFVIMPVGSINETWIFIDEYRSPDSPAVEDVRRYLGEFLMDPYVIDLPWLLRTLLVKGIILRTRPAQSAEAYEEIWTENGSPLIHYCATARRRLEHQIRRTRRNGHGLRQSIGAPRRR